MYRKLLIRVGLILAIAVISIAAIYLSFLAVYAKAISTTPDGEVSGRIISGHESRRYILHVPDTVDPSTPVPLVISLHGFAEWPAHQMEISRWNDLADAHGFLVVYPAGTGLPPRWRIRSDSDETAVTMTDVEFISNLIDSLMGQYNIDPTRIYANGLSNGGGMADMLGCTLSDRIAAIGGVSGAYLFPREDCHPPRPVPVIAFHGTADPIVPYAGGESSSFHYPFPPVTDWAADWAVRDGCPNSSVSLPAVGTVTGIRYGGCLEDAEVILYTIHGGGHSWPGGGSLPRWLVGETTLDIDATATMWEFFMRHPMPAVRTS
jgi:polyhydroxybutyrate depolymerase